MIAPSLHQKILFNTNLPELEYQLLSFTQNNFKVFTWKNTVTHDFRIGIHYVNPQESSRIYSVAFRKRMQTTDGDKRTRYSATRLRWREAVFSLLRVRHKCAWYECFASFPYVGCSAVYSYTVPKWTWKTIWTIRAWFMPGRSQLTLKQWSPHMTTRNHTTTNNRWSVQTQLYR